MTKRGPKSTGVLKGELKAMTAECNSYRSQLRRRETDFEQRTMSNHTEELRVLKSELEVTKKSATEARKSRDLAVASLDALSNKLTSERIVHTRARS